MDTRLNIRNRVMAGVAFLDENVPQWRERIDPNELRMNSGTTCVLGQVFEGYDELGRSGFLYAIDTFGTWYTDTPTCDWQVDRAFAYMGIMSYEHEDEVLLRAWRLVLAA